MSKTLFRSACSSSSTNVVDPVLHNDHTNQNIQSRYSARPSDPSFMESLAWVR